MNRPILATLLGVLTLGTSLLLAPVVANAQPGAPVASCDSARTAYDEQLGKITTRARELGWTDEDVTRIRGLAEQAQGDGTITEPEQQTILQDPAVQRIRGQLNLDDLLALRELGARANALLRCQQESPGTTVTETATPTTQRSTATATPRATSSSTAPSSESDSTNTVGSAPSSTTVLDKDGNPTEVQVRVLPSRAPETGDGSTAP